MRKLLSLLILLPSILLAQESWVRVELQPDNYPSETSWEIINSSGEVIATNPPITDMSLQTTIVPLDSEDYNFVIYDSFGDGICCGFGEGWFGLSNDCGLEEYVYDFGGPTATVFFTLEQCAQPPPPTIGCMDSTAINYDPEATQNSYTGLVAAPSPPSNCNQVAWTNNYFGVDVDYYIENQDLFVVGTEISVSGYTYFIDGSGIPNNCNAGVATIYVVYTEDQADGDVFNTYIPQALYNDVLIGDTWSINPCEYIYGCNNELANNYDPIATTNDGSCIYITGCMDPEATNYNPAANLEFAPGMPGPPPCQYFVLDTTSCGTDSVELIVSIVVDQYPSETSWWVKASWGETLAEIFPGDYAGLPMGTEVNTAFCVADGTAITFFIEDTYGDGLGGAQWGGIDGTWAVYTACDTIGNGAGNFGPATLANGNVGDCDDLPIEGCTDNAYTEYNPEAVIDDGGCLTPNAYGCIEENSINYDGDANTAEQFSNCGHTLNLTDLSENGWGGSFLMVTQGENYYGPFTVESGASFTTTLDLNSNEIVKAFFYSDPLSANFMIECGFEIVSPTGEIITSGGDNPILNPIRLSPFMYSGLAQCLETCIPMVFGCTDATACNYDPEANTLSSCTYNIEYYDCINQCNNDTDGDGVCDELEIMGCQDPLQYNFNPSATDPGECEAFVYGCTDNTMFNFNPEANTDNNSCIPIVNGCTDIASFNYNILANIDNNTCVPYAYGCIDITAFNYDILANTDDGTCIPYLFGCTDADALNFNPLANTDDNSCIPYLYGCTDDTALNYNDLANTDDDSCIPFIYGCTDSSMWNYSLTANTDDGSCISFIYGCTDPLMFNFDTSANTDNGTCIPYIYGCTDPTMFNYNAEANSDNNSCEPFIYGCTNEMAFNYNPAANAEYDPTNCEPFVYGCTDPSMLNYNSEANTEDFSCIDYIYGCTDPLAFNYDPLANTENGSCIEVVEGCADPEAYNYEALVNIPNPEACLYDAGCYGGPGEPYWLNDGCYAWVIDVDDYCCTDDWDASCVSMYNYCQEGWPAGVNDIDSKMIVVYPNPSADIFIVDTRLDVQIEVYDINGKKIISQTSKEISLGDYPTGIYVMTLVADEIRISKRILKQ